MPPLSVAIDLTTLEWRGTRPPARSLPVRFAEAITQRAPTTMFSVLVRSENRAALAHLEAANARLIVAEPGPARSVLPRLQARVRLRLHKSRFAGRLEWLNSLQPALSRWRPGFLARLGVRVVLCPFTSSGFSEPAVPLVVAVSDLQHLSQPYLLGSSDRTARAQACSSTFRRATRIVCSTPWLRDLALQSDSVVPEHILTIAPGRLLTPPAPTAGSVAATLAQHALTNTQFLLLAEDFEPRHNHRVVLTALSILRARLPSSEIRLVCVGGPDSAAANFRIMADQMGLRPYVYCAGALGGEDTSALIQASRAVLAPALYETVGETVLEAMQLGRPVLSSQIPGLAELTGSAALTFDPHRPADLAAAFECVERDPALLNRLARLGQSRVAAFDAAQGVAEAYLGVLLEAQAA
ncbi:MAG: glycosyltransferase [Chloroflexota bacterium]